MDTRKKKPKKPVEGGGCTQEEADYWKEYALAARRQQ